MDAEPKFKNGHWIWDDEKNTVQFITHDVGIKESMSVIGTTSQIGQKKQEITSIRFRETVETMERLKFRRYHQRKILAMEPEFITIQDVKDVALFIANRKDLSPEFISYFHLPEVDRFLKAMIIYFQFFLQIWDYNLFRREEASRKLRQPVVTKLENVIRDDLSDIRSMVGREYCSIILGFGKVGHYHHLASGTNSLSEKDRRLFEALICMTVRVVWIALQRKQLHLIDLEVNQMLRSDHFNVIVHRSKLQKYTWRTEEEERVLLGNKPFKEMKLKQRSFPCKELLYGDHDYRMLGMGVKVLEPTIDRTVYLEGLFAVPDEMLLELGHTIGLIGCPRDDYDPLLLPREKTPQNWDIPVQDPIDIKLPPRRDVNPADMPKRYSNINCPYAESAQTIRSRKEQCRMWKNHILRKVPKKAEGTHSGSVIGSEDKEKNIELLQNFNV